ncbi:MAG TPA: helix-turn-helix domain-containing protein [Natronosporangium sp.]
MSGKPESTATEVAQPGGVPYRELTDPSTLRALSHPVRLRILDELATTGPATATQLAERLGESAANCSWHLRQLARHGFIEEAGGGTGRERPWRVVVQASSISDIDRSRPEAARALDGLLDVLAGWELEALRAWRARKDSEPEEWRNAALETSRNQMWLTADELTALKQELCEVLDRRLTPVLERLDPANRPAGTRPVRIVAWGIPAGPPYSPPD